MTRTTQTRHARRGVTLVEMLVATAMCILGMWMLTWMFQQATASFSLANAQVTLTGQERMVTTLMTRDLESNKFPDDDTLPNRGRRLSDLGGAMPRGGYFRVRSSPPGIGTNPAVEGTDSNGFQTTRSTDHFIQFTSILADTPGNRYFSEVPAGSGTTFSGIAAEISYFLWPSGQTPSGVQLYDLMRVQRLVALSDHDARDYLNGPNGNDGVRTAYQNGDLVHEVMVASNTAGPRMHTLAELASATGPRFGRQPRTLTPAPASKRFGEDRLMSNVLSFEVKLTGRPGPGGWPTQFTAGNTDAPYDNLPASTNYEFDTGNPSKFVITGVQIRIRALNGTTTRQTTLTLSL